MSVSSEVETPAMMEPGTFNNLASTGCVASMPAESNESLGHGRLVLSRWDILLDLTGNGYERKAVVDGQSLNIASVTAVAR